MSSPGDKPAEEQDLHAYLFEEDPQMKTATLKLSIFLKIVKPSKKIVFEGCKLGNPSKTFNLKVWILQVEGF